MGLDDFMNIDSDSSTDSENNSSSSDDSSETDGDYEFDFSHRPEYCMGDDGTWQHKGRVGYKSQSSFADTVDHDQDIDIRPSMKHLMPIFTHLSTEKQADVGVRYRTTPRVIGSDEDYPHHPVEKDITCIGAEKVKVEDMPREIMMLEVGETNQDECIGALEEELDIEIDKDTELWLHTFAKITEIARVAIADEETEGEHVNDKVHTVKDLIGHRVTMDRAYSDKYPNDLKRSYEIDLWDDLIGK